MPICALPQHCAPLPILSSTAAWLKAARSRSGEAIDLKVATPERLATARNHTATHLLQSALRQVLGEHVKQAGSLVEPERLRFDFTHFSAMTQEEIRRVEEIVNGFVMTQRPGGLPGDGCGRCHDKRRYGPFRRKIRRRVRVVQVGDVSMELCGGTHVVCCRGYRLLQNCQRRRHCRRSEAYRGGNR